MTVLIRSKHSPRERVHPLLDGESRTKQAMKDECDVNKIMEKFQRTGAVSHFSKHAPQYGMANSMQLAEALNIVTEARSMFAELPSSLRTRFNGDPGEFLDFVQDPANAAEMVDLGLAVPRETWTEKTEPAAPEAAPEAPKAPDPASSPASEAQ